MGQIRGRSKTWKPARGASRFRTLPVSLPLIKRPGGGRGPELREETACRGPVCSPAVEAPKPSSQTRTRTLNPGPRAPARAHFGLVESWRLGHGAKRAPRRCSLRRRSVVPAGSMAGPLSRGPAVTAARQALLNGARLHPACPGPRPRPLAGAPAPPSRPAQCISWNSCRAAGTYPSHLGAAARPQSLDRDAGLEAPVGSGCSRLAGLSLLPGPCGTVTLLPGRLQCARPELEAGNRCASQTAWGSHSTGRDTRSSQNHTT